MPGRTYEPKTKGNEEELSCIDLPLSILLGLPSPTKNQGFALANKASTLVPHNRPDGELSHHMNTRVQNEPRNDLRKRNHSQQQKNGILLLIHKFEKLCIHEMNEGGLSKTLKESVDLKGIIFPPPPFTC